ncbi:MAG: hypothetical protein JO199_07445, partial [Candidatus Eremiobacteraeota bacterium]|nr:hypothetical protein [Candidatus Eremiobacteraeota bacterium]
EKIVYNFTGGTDGSFPAAGLTNIGGVLYGTTSGSGYPGTSEGDSSIFRITTGGTLTSLHAWDPATNPFPAGGIAQVGKALYSTTNDGGMLRRGTVFSVTP